MFKLRCFQTRMLRVLSRERRISRRWWRRRRAIFMRQDRKPPLGTLERYFKYRLTETGVRGNSGPINRLGGRQVRNEADHDHACKLHTRVRRLLARSQKMRPSDPRSCLLFASSPRFPTNLRREGGFCFSPSSRRHGETARFRKPRRVTSSPRKRSFRRNHRSYLKPYIGI